MNSTGSKNSECVALLQWALPRLKLRWAGFRKVRSQVCKRIRRRIRSLGLRDFAAYREQLECDPGEWETLDGFCRITISRFYRDKNVFRTIGERVLPELAERAERDHRDVRCWCSGCASGEEVYTLKILWDHIFSDTHREVGFTVLATDVDETVLSRASYGCYGAGSLKDVPPGWIEHYFETRGDEFCVKPKHHRGVTFLRQDIRHEMPDGPFDLVQCRNLILTYFDPPLQRQLIREIAALLTTGGYLVIGTHEALPADVTGFRPVPKCPEILQWHG